MFWDTVFDVVSLCISVVEVAAAPTNPMSWVSLAGDVVDLIPFVTGAGETAKVIGATIKITNAVDNTTDTIKVVKAVDLSTEALSELNKLERVGEAKKNITRAVKSTRDAGQKIHKGYKKGIEVPDIIKPQEHSFNKANRFDFFDRQTIFELKPNGARGLRDGIKQFQRYNKATGKKYNLVLELYG